MTVRAEHDEHAHSGPEPHAFVGLSLVAGFILMYLIDEIPKHLASSGASRPMHISLANLSQGPHRASSPTRSEHGDASDEYADEGLSATAAGSATTIGLVIHAAADGIALAASSFIAEKSVGLVVFLAVMIHKAPAAFGLTSVLLKQGLTKRQARAHLVVFSLAAPVGALATWVLVNVLAGGRIEGGQTTQFWTGLLLLFSGGTFLCVYLFVALLAHARETNGCMTGMWPCTRCRRAASTTTVTSTRPMDIWTRGSSTRRSRAPACRIRCSLWRACCCPCWRRWAMLIEVCSCTRCCSLGRGRYTRNVSMC